MIFFVTFTEAFTTCKTFCVVVAATVGAAVVVDGAVVRIVVALVAGAVVVAGPLVSGALVENNVVEGDTEPTSTVSFLTAPFEKAEQCFLPPTFRKPPCQPSEYWSLHVSW